MSLNAFGLRAFLLLSLCFVMVGLAPPVSAKTLNLVAFGDSLTAGYLLPNEAAFPNVLEAQLKAQGLDVRVTNAGVSGDTASAGLARLDWAVGDGVDGVLLELGANDMLRGLDPDLTFSALDQIIQKLQARKIPVMLMGMVADPSLGDAYGKKFNGIYARLAKAHGLLLYPFFLDGIATDASLKLKDGLHPTREGVVEMVRRILPSVMSFLKTLKA